MGNMEEQGLACACYVASLGGSPSRLRKWEGLKSGLPLTPPPPPCLKCEKASKTTWPMIKTSFWKACPPLHNERIVPYYDWSSFSVKRAPPPKAILNQSNRSPLTDICLTWKALLQMRGVEECRSESRTPPISNRTISNPVYFFAKHQRSHRATSQMFLRIRLYFTITHTYLCMSVCVCTIYWDCVNINVFRQQRSSHHGPNGAQHAQHNVFHIKC